jgi:hypothetical protein
MSKAQNALVILKKNLGFQDFIELCELISNHLEIESQEFMKTDKEERH